MTDQEKLEYHHQMQKACKFSDEEKVWVAIEKHSNPGAVYKKLLAGLWAPASAEIKKQFAGCSDIDSYKAVIQAKCNFEDQGKVWAAMDTHKYTNDLYRILAQVMAGIPR